jgi:hypothetical protein
MVNITEKIKEYGFMHPRAATGASPEFGLTGSLGLRRR